MAKRVGWSVLVAMVAALGWESSCSAQAFFPLLRVNDTVNDTRVKASYYTTAVDFSSGNPDEEPASVDEHDTNDTIVSDTNDAVDADVNATSTVTSEAEILPASGSWMALAQCMTSIGGLWQLNYGALGFAAAENIQDAEAEGEFEVLPNSTDPTALLGTANVVFTINFQAGAWDSGWVEMTCGDKSLSVTFSGGAYEMKRYDGETALETLYGDAAGEVLIPTTFDVEVGDVIPATCVVHGSSSGAGVSGPGTSDIAIFGLSANTSLFISKR